MKTLHILIGLVGCGLLIGCAHDQPKSASSGVSQPKVQVAGGQSAAFSVVASTNGAPLYYQWQFNGTNLSGVSATNLSIQPVPNK
jgi:hypothetical protein